MPLGKVNESRRMRDIRERLEDIEQRLSMLEALPRPLIWVVGRPMEDIRYSDCQPPTAAEH